MSKDIKEKTGAEIAAERVAFWAMFTAGVVIAVGQEVVSAVARPISNFANEVVQSK